MTFRHLKIFISVSDELNMTRAAEKMYISQPSVSQAIQELEKHYNVKLFERLGKKLYLTHAGKKLLNYARHIVHLVELTDKEMKELQENYLIRIGATATIGTYLLCDFLTSFQQNNPSIKVNSLVDNTKNIIDKLLFDDIDLALVEGFIHSEELIVKPFMIDELVLIFPYHHKFSQFETIHIEDLKNENFLVREVGSGTRELLFQELNRKGIELNIVGEYNNFELIKSAVINNLGISVISKKAIKNEVENKVLRYKKISDINLIRNFSIIYHKNKYISIKLKKFMETML